MTEKTREVARRLVEDVINAGDLDAFDELVSPAYVDRSDPGATYGRDDYREQIVATRRVFPDLRMSIEDEVVDGDRVALRLRWQATLRGRFMGVEGTGQRIDVTAIGILRVEDGRLVERWNETDVLGMLQQLGALPAGLGTPG